MEDIITTNVKDGFARHTDIGVMLDSLVSLHLTTRNAKLVEARKAKGWTQKQLGAEVGRSAPWVGQVETLKVVPSDDMQWAIGEALGESNYVLFPLELMVAIKDGVFEHRDVLLTATQFSRLTEAQSRRLAYDGETKMIEDLDREVLTESVGELLETLDLRPRRMIEMRFGLGHYAGEGSRTLSEVAEEFNLTKERIRQIEAKTLRGFRHPDKARRLEPFL